MACPRTGGGDQQEFLGRLYRKMVEHRVPLAGSLELTRRCNLRCVHCYLSPGDGGHATELAAGPWREILEQIAAAGCLDLLITGGEPLLREDFAQLYTFARERGLVVTVFTNATLVTDEIVALFREVPPQLVEATIYGVSAPTHERVTGVPGSYARCLDGVRRLRDNGIRVGLKTMLMTLNRQELAAMRRLASELGVRFRFDAALFPRLNGDRAPMAFRVPSEEAVAAELSDPDAVRSWRAYYTRMRDAPVPDTLYQCGAGHTGFHIDAAGNLQPCLMAGAPGYPILSEGGFVRGWRDVIPEIVDRKAGTAASPCQSCSIRALCGHCPAFSKLECGDERVHSPYLCATAHRREACLRTEPAWEAATP